MSRQEPGSITREELERIAEEWQVEISDLWPALDAAEDDRDQDQD